MGNQLIRHAAFFAVMLLSTACGYHLRGALDIPEEMKNIYIEGASASLRDEINLSLKSADGQLVSSTEEASMVIKVIRDDMRRRVLSLNSAGKATEFELNYTVRFMLLDPTGQILMDQQEVEINRDFFNDQVDILAKSNEEAVIRDEIYRQAVRAIVMRARAVLKN
ncbi:LPS assembly lipoprotein LptE [Methylomarinum sp. Ch1-1]|uniref:LPS-assembly lipoprotein LptE n=1 Tax=Methylomarinum roseum TaxID=3067653 RepID=A0AAU7NVK6_9GAMM|nr:LPS assembly lipoprotein LptE [Methylomarinum sp. Ch1-1]MDP4519307.1 LPS assembly lipoprotein LptE [Methylomarinum sp. Ch1-1]